MKSNYEKYIEEVREIKEKAYQEFLNSGLSSYTEYIKKSTEKDIKKYNIKFANRNIAYSVDV